MKVRVLGCSGAIAKGCRTTSFLINESVLVDAGTGVGDLTLDEMRKIDHVLLTHSHLDHIAALPLMLDAVSSLRTAPVTVYAPSETIDALQTHIFNNVIWPDFSRIPSASNPFLTYQQIAEGEVLQVADLAVEALPAVHSVPAVGYAIKGNTGWWVFSGDTERNPAFWARVNQLPVALLVIETAFSNREQELAKRSLHLSPATLAAELACIAQDRTYPIFITHTKPSETALIMSEIGTAGIMMHRLLVAHDIQWLQAGQSFEL
ncbi:MBL fold metallo-hydrolase [Acidovorax sp. NPDC077693]|uniref:MBL fold metallo-hydrolase n=1 Tax=unclassified Acidovorax TaxID=2684926 RepID=UPI0037CB1822